MVISQGDIFWIDLREPKGSEPGFRRPCVVIQNDLLNHSKLQTAVICLLTTNLRQAGISINVQLAKGTANLPRTSVATVTQILTVDKADLFDKIGTLPRIEIQKILSGIVAVIEPDY